MSTVDARPTEGSELGVRAACRRAPLQLYRPPARRHPAQGTGRERPPDPRPPSASQRPRRSAEGRTLPESPPMERRPPRQLYIPPRGRRAGLNRPSSPGFSTCSEMVPWWRAGSDAGGEDVVLCTRPPPGPRRRISQRTRQHVQSLAEEQRRRDDDDGGGGDSGASRPHSRQESPLERRGNAELAGSRQSLDGSSPDSSPSKKCGRRRRRGRRARSRSEERAQTEMPSFRVLMFPLPATALAPRPEHVPWRSTSMTGLNRAASAEPDPPRYSTPQPPRSMPHRVGSQPPSAPPIDRLPRMPQSNYAGTESESPLCQSAPVTPQTAEAPVISTEFPQRSPVTAPSPDWEKSPAAAASSAPSSPTVQTSLSVRAARPQGVYQPPALRRARAAEGQGQPERHGHGRHRDRESGRRRVTGPAEGESGSARPQRGRVAEAGSAHHRDDAKADGKSWRPRSPQNSSSSGAEAQTSPQKLRLSAQFQSGSGDLSASARRRLCSDLDGGGGRAASKLGQGGRASAAGAEPVTLTHTTGRARCDGVAGGAAAVCSAPPARGDRDALHHCGGSQSATTESTAALRLSVSSRPETSASDGAGSEDFSQGPYTDDQKVRMGVNVRSGGSETTPQESETYYSAVMTSSEHCGVVNTHQANANHTSAGQNESVERVPLRGDSVIDESCEHNLCATSPEKSVSGPHDSDNVPSPDSERYFPATASASVLNGLSSLRLEDDSEPQDPSEPMFSAESSPFRSAAHVTSSVDVPPSGADDSESPSAFDETLETGTFDSWADEVDEWERQYTDDGELHAPTPQATSTPRQPIIDYLAWRPEAVERGDSPSPERGALPQHVIEVYDFPASFTTQDLGIIYQEFSGRGFNVKWVDDTHALAIFSSPACALEALQKRHPMLRTRPLRQASRQSQQKAARCLTSLQPYRPRPETCALRARRMVATALGLRAHVPQEKRDRERQQIQMAKDKKRQAAKQREDAWEGRF